MVSTEAGGEGINLHENCHVMVNYDLPWNPSRLVQRAGRLYRYGQKERVIVFNLKLDDGFDNKVLNLMLARLGSIARDMASVGQEYSDGLEVEILGELLERIDIAFDNGLESYSEYEPFRGRSRNGGAESQRIPFAAGTFIRPYRRL